MNLSDIPNLFYLNSTLDNIQSHMICILYVDIDFDIVHVPYTYFSIHQCAFKEVYSTAETSWTLPISLDAPIRCNHRGGGDTAAPRAPATGDPGLPREVIVRLAPGPHSLYLFNPLAPD
jgi:hypothetical protein